MIKYYISINNKYELCIPQTAIPVMAPTAGEIIEMCVEDGATVTPGTILFKLKAGAAGGGAKPGNYVLTFEVEKIIQLG